MVMQVSAELLEVFAGIFKVSAGLLKVSAGLRYVSADICGHTLDLYRPFQACFRCLQLSADPLYISVGLSRSQQVSVSRSVNAYS